MRSTFSGRWAGALDAAHGRGLVHRDVKPGNMLLAEGEHAYLCDFGLSKQVSSISGLTASGEFLGTVNYAAPEQIRGDAVDFRADLYSLGCVLYECLAGETPFRRDSDLAVLWAHLQEEPPRSIGEAPTSRRSSTGSSLAPSRRSRTNASGAAASSLPRPGTCWRRRACSRRSLFWSLAAAFSEVFSEPESGASMPDRAYRRR